MRISGEKAASYETLRRLRPKSNYLVKWENFRALFTWRTLRTALLDEAETSLRVHELAGLRLLDRDAAHKS